MRFNMGCGHNRAAGFVNVDAAPECEPDQIWDLERTPWPWPDGCAEEVRFVHSLEHMGGDPKVFLAMMAELYRILAPGGSVLIHVPHPRHDDFLNDPTHVRPITPAVLSLFDRVNNDAWKEARAANTPLAHYTGADFVIRSVRTVLDEPWASRLREGAVSKEEVAAALRSSLNVAKELQITMTARKA